MRTLSFWLVLRWLFEKGWMLILSPKSSQADYVNNVWLFIVILAVVVTIVFYCRFFVLPENRRNISTCLWATFGLLIALLLIIVWTTIGIIKNTTFYLIM